MDINTFTLEGQVVAGSIEIQDLPRSNGEGSTHLTKFRVSTTRKAGDRDRTDMPQVHVWNRPDLDSRIVAGAHAFVRGVMQTSEQEFPKGSGTFRTWTNLTALEVVLSPAPQPAQAVKVTR
jgi:hypothetical protein